MKNVTYIQFITLQSDMTSDLLIPYLASTMLLSTSSIDFPCVETKAPTRLDLFFLSFSHC